MRTLLLLFVLMSTGCGWFGIGMKGREHKDPPPKLAEPKYRMQKPVIHNGVSIWIADPVWGQPEAQRVSDGYLVKRTSTNSAAIWVRVADKKSANRKCYWGLYRVSQQIRTTQPQTPNFDQSAYLDDDQRGSKAYAVDCDLIKSMIADDPAYGETAHFELF